MLLKLRKLSQKAQHTVKGKGVEEMEGQAGWHGKAPSEEQGVAFVNEIMGVQ